MTIKLYINGVERTEWVKYLSLTISRDISGISKCNCILEDKDRGFRPTKGHLFKVSDGASPETVYFAGNIFRIRERQHEGTAGPDLQFSIECVDYNHILNRRLVWAVWENQSLYSIVNHINTYFLTGEGITLGSVENPGPTVTERVEVRGETVRAAFSKLSAITGYQFYVDFDKELHVSQFSSNAAPFNITDSTGEWLTSSLEIDRDDNDYRNRQHERSELTIDSTFIDTYTATAGQTLFATTAPITQVRSITITSASPVGVKTFTGIDPFDAPPASGYDFYYITQTYNVHALDWTAAGGEEVSIEYVGEVLSFRPGQVDAGAGTQVVTVNDTAEQTARASLSGGSGIWEAIEEQRNISSAAALRAIGTGRLRQFGQDVIKIGVTSIKNDALIEPSQRVTVTLADHSINESFFCERADYTWKLINDVDYFEQRLALTNLEPFGSVITPVQKLAEMARIGPPSGMTAGAGADDTTVEQGEEIRACWVLDGTLATGTGLGNKVPINVPDWATVEFIEAIALVETAPTGATIIFDINLEGASVFATTKLVIPISSTAVAVQASFSSPAPVGARHEILSLDIDQVGSTIAGADGFVLLRMRYS